VDIADLLHTVGKRTFRAPALHFALLGGFVYLGVTWAGGEPGGRQLEPIEVPMYRIQAAVREFEATVARPATRDEVLRVAAIVRDDEVLFEYALDLDLDRQPLVQRRLAQIAGFLETNPEFEEVEDPAGEPAGSTPSTSELADLGRELGLHQQDVITRRILIDSARRLIRAAALVRAPTEMMITDYLDAHPEEFSRPGATRITQITLLASGQLDALSSEAEQLLARLESEEVRPEEADRFGDDSPLPRHLPLLPERDIARQFGSRFTEGLAGLPVRSWQGPLTSSQGLHIVYVHERAPGSVPALSEIRDEVVAKVRQKLADEWLALRLAQLRDQYEIVMPGGMS